MAKTARRKASAKAQAAPTAQTPFATRIDIPEDRRHALVALLNQTLADTFDLYSQTKQAHWNVKGRDFYQLHLLYDELAEKLTEPADQLAERAVLLGGYAFGTVRMAAQNSRIAPFPGADVDAGEPSDPSYMSTLADRWAAYAQHVREDNRRADEIGDPGTVNLYDDLSDIADRGLWFIEAHLQRYRGGLDGDGADPTS